MKTISFLKTLYSDIISKAASLPDEFRDEVILEINKHNNDLSFIHKAILANSSKVFEAIYVKYASDYNYESGFFFKRNYDLNEGWTAFLDAYRAGKVKSIQEWVEKRRRTKPSKKKKKKKANIISPIDSYCDSKKNVNYWEELLDGEDDASVKDFIKYIKEIKC